MSAKKLLLLQLQDCMLDKLEYIVCHIVQIFLLHIPHISPLFVYRLPIYTSNRIPQSRSHFYRIFIKFLPPFIVFRHATHFNN